MQTPPQPDESPVAGSDEPRQARLQGLVAIDICSMAIMSNPIHLVACNRPDIAGQWSDEDVTRRWSNLFPGRKTEDDKPAEPEPHELAMLMADSEALTDQTPGG